jgi:hypothetical protein
MNSSSAERRGSEQAPEPVTVTRLVFGPEQQQESQPTCVPVHLRLSLQSACKTTLAEHQTTVIWCSPGAPHARCAERY